METLDRALVNVYNLLIVIIPPIQFGCNAPHNFLGACTPIFKYFEKTGIRKLSNDRALVSSYRLSIVIMLPPEAVWPQFTMQV